VVTTQKFCKLEYDRVVSSTVLVFEAKETESRTARNTFTRSNMFCLPDEIHNSGYQKIENAEEPFRDCHFSVASFSCCERALASEELQA